ncbi:hypothetical protein K439DRAFT_201668 [Ramaria rubella]|nr:hypothetical protein K439DRAFT_201668 [Ramaria rubella]
MLASRNLPLLGHQGCFHLPHQMEYQERFETDTCGTGSYQSPYGSRSYGSASYNASSYGSSSSRGGGMQYSPTAEHVWIERSNATPEHALTHLIVEIARDGVKSYFCGWEGCRYPVGFAKQSQLIAHIRSMHLQEKPYLCTTCNVAFERKQEAIRHVTSLNSSRQYRCSGCDRVFSRKHYRDVHEEICLSEEPIP